MPFFKLLITLSIPVGKLLLDSCTDDGAATGFQCLVHGQLLMWIMLLENVILWQLYSLQNVLAV